MAIKRMIRAPKTQKPKKTRSVVKSIDDKYYGPEPLDISAKGMAEALNWYNYMFELDQAREWLLEYLKRHSPKTVLADVRRSPKYMIPTTIGWHARKMMNGNTLPESSMQFFNERLALVVELGKNTKEKTEEKVDRPVVSIQERTRAKNDMILAECESEVIDNQTSMYDFLQKNQVTPAAANHIKSFYQRVYDEVFSEDPDVKESYGKRLKIERAFWQTVVDDLDRYIGNKKITKVRKPKTIKLKPPSDLVKSLKFQKEFLPLKIVSCNPAEIIGAQQLWTYNTKTRKLTKYDAVGPNGIQVKGTTLTGFDAEKSSTKTLRKPDITIQSLLGAGKVMIRKFMDELKTLETKPNGRINSDTILLRVIK